MAHTTNQSGQQEAEQLRLENARLRELLRQSDRIRLLYEGALEQVRKVETSLSEANAVLKAMHLCGQTLLRASGEGEWLRRVCEIVVEGTDYKLAWIGYPDAEGRCIRLMAKAGIEGRAADSGLACLMLDEDRACPVAKVVQTGKAKVIEDIGRWPECTPWFEKVAELGFNASVILPLGRHGEHDGVLCLYAKASDAFDRQRLKLLRQLAGEVSFGISFLREQQQRELAEQTLNEGEERLQLAFAAAKQAWFDLDVQSGEALLSPEYAPIFGYEPEEFDHSLQHWKGDLHPDDREAVLAAFDECLATGGPTTMEYRRRTKDGGWKWVLSIGKIVAWDGERKPLRMIGIHMDISDRKGMESALQASEDQYRRLFENSGEAILLGGPDGRIYSANPAACRMFGRSEEELIRIGRSGVVDESDPSVRKMMEAREKSGLFRGEVNMLRANGSPFPVELSSVQFVDSHGRQRLSLLMQDITVRKRHEVLLQARLRLVNAGNDVDHLDIMRETLDLAEDITNSKIGFFHFVDKDQETITLQAWSTNTIEHMCTAEAAGMNYKLTEAGVWAEAIRKRAPVIHNDYRHLENRQGMPEGHAAVEREVCVPVLREGKVVAAIGVGNKSSDYIEEDVEALSQLANLSWDFIEAKKVQIAVRESELRYKAMFQSVADYALVLAIRDGGYPVIVDANDAALAKHGYTREEMIGQPISLIDKKVRPEDAAEIVRHLMMGKSIHFEMEHTCKDGSTFPIESSARLVKSEKGSVLFIAVERDISERKRIEREMERTKADLLEAQRIAHVGSWRLDVASNRVFWSEELYKMYGYDPSLPPPLYTESAKFFTAESWQRLDGALRHTLETGAGYELELEFVRCDGVHGWMLARGEAQREVNGAIIDIHGIAMDITQHKKAEELMQRRMAELERFTKAAVRREFRIKELKDQLEGLKNRGAGQA